MWGPVWNIYHECTDFSTHKKTMKNATAYMWLKLIYGLVNTGTFIKISHRPVNVTHTPKWWSFLPDYGYIKPPPIKPSNEFLFPFCTFDVFNYSVMIFLSLKAISTFLRNPVFYYFHRILKSVIISTWSRQVKTAAIFYCVVWLKLVFMCFNLEDLLG